MRHVRTLVLATVAAVFASLASCATPGGLADPAHYDSDGVHVVSHGQLARCPVCELYRMAQGYVVRLVTPTGVGAGVVLTPDGRLATNAHVVGANRTVEVESFEGRTFRGNVLAADTEQDLAVVTVSGDDMRWAPPSLLRGAPPPVGSDVYVIGHPLGLGWTVTRGIISGYRRVGPQDMIQTDAAISPGNSGGAMLDRDGHLIGIVTSKLQGGGVENVSFARPTATLLELLADLKVGVTP